MNIFNLPAIIIAAVLGRRAKDEGNELQAELQIEL